MDPPAELPLNGTHEELALGKINWLPGEERRGCAAWKGARGGTRESRWKRKKENWRRRGEGQGKTKVKKGTENARKAKDLFERRQTKDKGGGGEKVKVGKREEKVKEESW